MFCCLRKQRGDEGADGDPSRVFRCPKRSYTDNPRIVSGFPCAAEITRNSVQMGLSALRLRRQPGVACNRQTLFAEQRWRSRSRGVDGGM